MEDRVVTAITIWTDHMSCLKYLLWLHLLVTLYQYRWEQPRFVLLSFSCPRWRKKRGSYQYGVPLRQPRIPVNTINNSAMGRILNSQILEMHSNSFSCLLYIKGILNGRIIFPRCTSACTVNPGPHRLAVPIPGESHGESGMYYASPAPHRCMNLHKRVVQLLYVPILPRSLVKDIQRSRFICSTDLVPLQRKPHGLYQTINLYTVHATCKRNLIKVPGL